MRMVGLFTLSVLFFFCLLCFLPFLLMCLCSCSHIFCVCVAAWLCLYVCFCGCGCLSVNFRPPILPGHERGAGVCDPDIPLAVYGVQDLHRVPAAPPWGRDDVLWQVWPRIPHVLRGHGLHTYWWVDGHAFSHDGRWPNRHTSTKPKTQKSFVCLLFCWLFAHDVFLLRSLGMWSLRQRFQHA